MTDPARRDVCGMAAALDKAIDGVLSSMAQKGLLENTLIIFTSDNGGVTAGGSSNAPLRVSCRSRLAEPAALLSAVRVQGPLEMEE